jgi:hypothetical protein
MGVVAKGCVAIRLTQLHDDISQSKAITLMYNTHRCAVQLHSGRNTSGCAKFVPQMLYFIAPKIYFIFIV